jgi:uncharacterized OB-fold protein
VEIPKEGNEVSTASAATGTDSGTSSKKPVVIALAAIGAVALIVGILWFVGAAPGFLNLGSHVKHGSHLFRGGVAAVVGLGLLVFAWIQNKKA